MARLGSKWELQILQFNMNKQTRDAWVKRLQLMWTISLFLYLQLSMVIEHS